MDLVRESLWVTTQKVGAFPQGFWVRRVFAEKYLFIDFLLKWVGSCVHMNIGFLSILLSLSGVITLGKDEFVSIYSVWLKLLSSCV